MKTWTLACVIVVAIAFAAVSASRGDTDNADGPDSAPSDTSEPITGTAVMPFKGSETPMKDPFSPYAAPDPWRYEDLSADEKADADRAIANDQAMQDGYAAASRDLAVQARANAAAIQLGTDENLGTVGVVP